MRFSTPRDEIFLFLLIMLSTDAQRVPKFQTVIGTHGDDFTKDSDIIFLLQRSGVSSADFADFKKFIMQGIQAVNFLGTRTNDSRIGIDLLTDEAENFVNFKSCCAKTVTDLLRQVDEGFTIYNQTRVDQIQIGDDEYLSPHDIDLEESLLSIKERYLDDGLSRTKPTLVLLVMNFQTSYMSYHLLDSAVDEIKLIKDSGAYIIAIIIDPKENRQPRFHRSGLRERYIPKSKGIAFDSKGAIVDEKYDEELEYVRSILRQFQSISQSNIAFGDDREDMSRWNVKPNNQYQQLTELYAKAIASKAEHGFKLSDFEELVSPFFLQLIKDLINTPMLYFGDGEVRATCPDTKNHVDKALWSRGYYDGEYNKHQDCEWRLAAREGYRISLGFDEFLTEETFDTVKIYDGYNQEADERIVTLSGLLTQDGNIPPQVVSTEEWMLIRFTSDGAFEEKGFHATWRPITQDLKIDGAFVVYLVDVSASADDTDMKSMVKWMKAATKHFVFEGGIGYNSAKPRSVKTGSKFGLSTFDSETHVIKHIGEPTTRVRFFQSMSTLNKTHGETHLGAALDFIRLKQFLFILGEEAFYGAKDIDNPPPKRLIFIVSDGRTVDNPTQAARRLCEWDIVPVIVATSEFDKQTRQQITSYCGLYVNIKDPVAQAMGQVKEHLLLPVNVTSHGKHPPPDLPTNPSPPTRTTTTTTTTTPSPPTTWPPWTGTFPTIKTPTTTPPAPIPDIFNYFAIAMLLASVGLIEVLSFIVMAAYTGCSGGPDLQTLSSKSAMNLARRVGIWHRKRMTALAALDPTTTVSSYSSPSLIDESDITSITDLDLRDSRYPSTASSFFERGAFLPKHLDEINKKGGITP